MEQSGKGASFDGRTKMGTARLGGCHAFVYGTSDPTVSTGKKWGYFFRDHYGRGSNKGGPDLTGLCALSAELARGALLNRTRKPIVKQKSLG
jgi:hypothetical protein